MSDKRLRSTKRIRSRPRIVLKSSWFIAGRFPTCDIGKQERILCVRPSDQTPLRFRYDQFI